MVAPRSPPATLWTRKVSGLRGIYRLCLLGVGGRRTARVYLVGDNEGIAAGEDDKVNEVFRGSSVCAATRPAADLRRRADWARLPVPGLPILAD